MVERPIKKSERQAVATSDGITQPSDVIAEPGDGVEAVLKAEPSPPEGAQPSDGIVVLNDGVAEPSNAVKEVLEAEPSPVEGAQEAVTQSSQKRSIPRPLAKDQKDQRDQKKGRGKEQNDRRSDRSPANPALMRGPKPTKPKPLVVEDETPSKDLISESVPEAEQVAATES